MDPATHLEHVRDEGRLLVDAATAGSGDEPVPGCPDWSLDDLVRHIGTVHLWATEALTRAGVPPDRDFFGATEAAAPQDHAKLVDWYAASHDLLVATLKTTDPAAPVWGFLPHPSGADFWARRQAHETAIHRFDAEQAVGLMTGVGTALAHDGVDEVLGFVAARGKRLVSPEPVTLGIRTVDTGGHWAMRIGPSDRALVDGDIADTDAAVTGTAADLYLFLWNRLDRVDSTGDADVIRLWRELAQIR
jgi:uncharacterized protein (TIGR03083 family)